MTVKCCKAGRWDACRGCEHADLHDPSDVHSAGRCTTWGECWTGDESIRVRCTRVPSEGK